MPSSQILVGELQSLENCLSRVPLLACPAVPNRYVKALLGKPAVAPSNFAVSLDQSPFLYRQDLRNR